MPDLNAEKLMKSFRQSALKEIAKFRDDEHARIKEEGHTNKAFENELYKHLYNEFDKIHAPLVEKLVEMKLQYHACKTVFARSKPVYDNFKAH